MIPRSEETGPGEAALVERARSGEAAAFEALVRLHHDRVWRVVWRIVRHDADTEEAVRQTFRTARAALGELPEATAPSTWLLRIAVHAAQEAVKPGRRVGQRLRLAGEDPAPGEGTDRPLRPEQTQAILEECMGTLDLELLVPIAVHLEGTSYDEVSRVVQVPVWTVRSRVFRARQALGGCLRRKRGGRG
jgi:RNA polymerase sigma-70 factor (ECF subfamily)